MNQRVHAKPDLPDPPEESIATCAYYRWRANGCPIGTEQEDWFAAKEFLRHQTAKNDRPLHASLANELSGAS